MLAIRLKAFDRQCQSTTGGVSRIWIFDRYDFNFTQPANDADGNKMAYNAIALRGGADPDAGALLYPVIFQNKTAEYSYTQSLTNGSSKYEHNIELLMPDLGQFITQWNEAVDAASACFGIGLIVELNSGKILVLGELYVNNAKITDWQMAQSGSTGTSGKLFEDVNGQTTKISGDYKRSAYEFTGGAAALEALETAGS